MPVWRIRYGDAAGTWLHVSPASGQILGSSDERSRLRRWLFNGLHSLDLPWLIHHRPAWDIVVWLLSIAGMVISVSGVVIGWRRLRRKLAPVRRGAGVHAGTRSGTHSDARSGAHSGARPDGRTHDALPWPGPAALPPTFTGDPK